MTIKRLTLQAMICRSPDGEGGGEAAPVVETPAAAPEGEAPPAGDPPADVSILGGAGLDGGDGDGAGDDTPPGDDPPADPEAEAAREAAIARLALPTPETYTVTVPEGYDGLDEEALAAAIPLLQKMGVKTDAEAQEVIDAFAADIAPKIAERAAAATQDAVQAAVDTQKKTWADETRADPEYGGANLKPNLALAAKALDQFGGQGFRTFLDETGLGMHPAMVKFAVNVGRQLGESGFHVVDTSSQEKLTASQRMYGEEFQPKR